MRSSKKIRRLFAESRVTVRPEADERIFRGALTTAQESGEMKLTLQGAKGWRTIMKSRITKLAAAAAIIIAAVVAGYAGYEALQPRELRLPSPAPISQQVAKASLIVRGKLLEKEGELMPDSKSTWKRVYWNVQIIRVLYGHADSQVISILTCEPPDHLRPPYVPTNEAGMELIMFLDKRDGQYRTSRIDYGNQRSPLDAKEKEILRAIRGDAHSPTEPEFVMVDGSSTSAYEDMTRTEFSGNLSGLDTTMARKVSRSSLIIRAKLIEQTTETRERTAWDVEAGWDVRILKVLYGHADSEVMSVVLSEPVENLRTLKPGMEVTMFFGTVDGQYRLQGTMLGASHALDEHILKVIATGAHLPASPELQTQFTTAGRRTLAQRVAGASLIIRGKFLEKPQVIPDKLGVWKKVRWNVRIIKVLYGKADSEVIRVFTCELPEQYKHLSPNPSAIEPGAEAILFLRVAQYQDAGMSFDGPDRTGRALDAVEQQLREVIESGDHLRVTPEPDNLDGVDGRL